MNINTLLDTSKKHHALLTADVRISTSPSEQLYLHCPSRRRLLVHVSPALLPPYFWLGFHHATVQLRTDATGKLKPTLRLLKVTKQVTDDPQPLIWSAAGLLSTDPNVLLVYPPSARSLPSRIHYRPGPEVAFEPHAAGESVLLQGVVRAGALVATSMSPTAPLARLSKTQDETWWL